MKKVTKSIFLITVLVIMLAFSMTAYAEPEDESNEVKMDYTIRGYNYIKFYISESQTEAGTLLVDGKKS